MIVMDRRPGHVGESGGFFAMENQTHEYDAVPKGTYQLKMIHRGSRGTCLQFVEIPGRRGKHRPFLIHATTRWQKLKGCIAPGTAAKHVARRAGVNSQLIDSRKAMDQIFELLDGFEENKMLTISIDNNPPGGDTWRKQQFINRRKKKRGT
jgi:hypothetical protein